jgi:excinuclease ABC subunit A
MIKESLSDIVVVDQAPIGASPRSNPATYVDAFTAIRDEFARETGQSASLFAFNSEGACPACKGLGQEIIDMHFLGDVRRVCDVCNGHRYREDVLEYRVRSRSIADVLQMTIEETHEHFSTVIKIAKPLRMLIDVGLGYLRTGQSLDTLSGGERQRIKLASKLKTQGATYALDEPTTGLHFADIKRLLLILDRLVDEGNTVIVVEHNLDVIKNADWIVDLGPGGGRFGGEVIVAGPPEQVAAEPKSVTGKFLKRVLEETR